MLSISPPAWLLVDNAFCRITNASTRHPGVTNPRGHQNAVLMLPNILVASTGYSPIIPNGIEIQNETGTDKTPNRNAFTNFPVGSGDFLSL